MATARILREQGYKVIVDPALRIHRLDPKLPDPGTVDRVLLTSAQAAFALAPFRHLPVHAVGEATARAARRQGALDVYAASGDWEDLARQVQAVAPQGGAILHLAGQDTAGDLGPMLAECGYRFERAVVYEALPSTALAARTRAALLRDGLDAVLLFSPRSARIWRDLVAEADLTDRLDGIVGACLSPSVATVVEDLPWQELRTAERRDQAALLDCLDAIER